MKPQTCKHILAVASTKLRKGRKNKPTISQSFQYLEDKYSYQIFLLHHLHVNLKFYLFLSESVTFSFSFFKSLSMWYILSHTWASENEASQSWG